MDDNNSTITTASLPPPTPSTTAPATTPSKPSLPTLPLDILFHLCTHLTYPSLLALSSTSRALHAALNPDLLCPKDEKISFYLRVERLPKHREKLACFVCFRLLDKDCFGDSKRRGRYGKNGRDVRIIKTRFCWECGVKGGRYEHLKRVNKGGLGYYPCHGCGGARVKSQRCSREGGCVVVVVERKGGDSGLERLPLEVQGRVFGMLGYEDLIRLKQVSRHLRKVVDPVRQCRDVYGMWEFVMSRMTWRMAWWGGSRACFGCFRVRGERHFSWEQYHISTSFKGGEYWRRRCKECLRRLYHLQVADVEARARFHRQEICGVCKCMRYRDEECRGCVVRKDEIAEWARRREEKMARRGKVFDVWEEAVIPFPWDDEDETAANEASESDDIWGEENGSCLEILGFGDEDSRCTVTDYASRPAEGSSRAQSNAVTAVMGRGELRLEGPAVAIRA